MSQEKFDLVFSGELVPGFALPQVKKNIQLLFRIDEAKTEALFSGRAIHLKKGLDAETANKYRVAIKKAGARVSIVESEEAPLPAQPAVPVTATRTPSSKVPTPPPAGGASVSPSGATLTTELGAQPLSPPGPHREIEAPAFDLASPGADILPADYKRPLAAVDVDTSALSVTPQGGYLVRPEELARPDAMPVSVPEIEVAPVGSDVLTAEERPKTHVVEVDVSGLSIAQPGERLGPPSKEAPAPPNVDHIKLER